MGNHFVGSKASAEKQMRVWAAGGEGISNVAVAGKYGGKISPRNLQTKKNKYGLACWGG